MNDISGELMAHIVGRILKRADNAVEEFNKDKKNGYKGGREEAYYEVLDIMINDFSLYDVDLKELGLDFDIDERFA